MIVGSLVVSGRDHGDASVAVSKSKNGKLRTCHALFDDNGGAGTAELLVFHHVPYCLLSLIESLSDDDTLAECETVALDYDRHRLSLEIIKSLLLFIEDLISRGRNGILLHELLGESLGPFDDGSICLGAEAPETCFLHLIYHAHGERVVGCNEDEIEVLFPGIFDHAFDVCSLNINTGSNGCDAAVAGSAVKLSYPGILLELPAYNVLSSAAAYY